MCNSKQWLTAHHAGVQWLSQCQELWLELWKVSRVRSLFWVKIWTSDLVFEWYLEFCHSAFRQRLDCLGLQSTLATGRDDVGIKNGWMSGRKFHPICFQDNSWKHNEPTESFFVREQIGCGFTHRQWRHPACRPYFTCRMSQKYLERCSPAQKEPPLFCLVNEGT